MSFGVSLKVWGDFACFTRPEMKSERVSYDVMTPSAARGILEAIYWKPAITWIIDRIHVLLPIRFTTIRRNELGGKMPYGTVKSAMKGGIPPYVFIEDDRQQRAALLLRNVAYVIDAHFDVAGDDANTAKHKEMFLRRARKGQCFNQPYLGCREFPPQRGAGELPSLKALTRGCSSGSSLRAEKKIHSPFESPDQLTAMILLSGESETASVISPNASGEPPCDGSGAVPLPWEASRAYFVIWTSRV